MVDFQSRDTNRGYGSDDEEEEEPEAEPEEEEPVEAETPVGKQPPETETAQQHDAASVEPDSGDTAGTPEEQRTSPPAETTATAEETPSQPTTDADDVREATPASTTPGATGAGPQEGSDTAPALESAAYAVVTITNERSLSDDDQGDVVVEAIEGAGDRVLTRDLVQPGYDSVQSTVSTLAERGDIDVVVTVGGTGVEPNDVTAEALEPLFEKQLPGFGELFRLLAHETEGTAVVGTRATAGIMDQTPVFALPGTITGVKLGMDEIVVPEGQQLAADAGADQ